jgi:hypothetical protein
MGKAINLDTIMASNESTIAVGNMKVNARGDELGHGGRVVKTKEQIMSEYYALNTPTITQPTIQEDTMVTNTTNNQALEDEWVDPPVPQTVPVPTSAEPPPSALESATPSMRGTLAAAVASKPQTVTQELMKTPKQQAKARGPQRI